MKSFNYLLVCLSLAGLLGLVYSCSGYGEDVLAVQEEGQYEIKTKMSIEPVTPSDTVEGCTYCHMDLEFCRCLKCPSCHYLSDLCICSPCSSCGGRPTSCTCSDVCSWCGNTDANCNCLKCRVCLRDKGACTCHDSGGNTGGSGDGPINYDRCPKCGEPVHWGKCRCRYNTPDCPGGSPCPCDMPIIQ